MVGSFLCRCLCDGSYHWKVVKETMNTQQEVKFLSYMQRIAQATEKIAQYYETVPHVTLPTAPIVEDKYLQHVGYDDAQCGREK